MGVINMNCKNTLILFFFIIFSLSFMGCTLKDDYIIKINDSTEQELSNKTIDEVFDNKDIKELLDKIKNKPKKITNNLDNVDSETLRILKEINQKTDDLTDSLNNADLKGKNQDLKNKIDNISDDIDKLKEKIENNKNELKTYENPIDKTEVTDLLDEYETHINNLESALSRLKNNN
eukprot:TRINITY_DN8941_c0_g1_i1.p4 TRINITY_DN8941_c0_g1~~TRINITY_DN8941_c0_g1_i1.p4  ORF type:complete len:177 (-),score=47.01 TRINITY_DN8941_c0_g1_i1:133-663(-)